MWRVRKYCCSESTKMHSVCVVSYTKNQLQHNNVFRANVCCRQQKKTYVGLHVKCPILLSNNIMFISVFKQLDAQNLFHSKFYFMPLHVSSTCAHHQEVKIALHNLWYHHTYKWPSRARDGHLRGISVMIPEAV